MSEEQEMIKKTVKELAAKEISPIAEEIDKTGRFPREVIKKMTAFCNLSTSLASK